MSNDGTIFEQSEAEQQKREDALVRRIAKHNGQTVEQVRAGMGSNSTDAPTPPSPAPVPPSYQEQVISRLTVIAWSTGIVAVVTVISIILTIVGITAASQY